MGVLPPGGGAMGVPPLGGGATRVPPLGGHAMGVSSPGGGPIPRRWNPWEEVQDTGAAGW